MFVLDFCLLFWQYCGLNLGLCTLTLEPHPQLLCRELFRCWNKVVNEKDKSPMVMSDCILYKEKKIINKQNTWSVICASEKT
jgi:hypothetical protein